MRRPDWHARMREAINTASLVPFQYGQHDCVLFAAYVIDQMCDSDYLERVRKMYQYEDQSGAERVIAEHGGLLELARGWLGEPVPVAQAMPGDLALVRNNDTVLFGIVEAHQVLAAGKQGVVPLPIKDAVCAWSIT